MKALFFAACVVLAIHPLHSFDVSLHDSTENNQYYFNSTLSITFSVKTDLTEGAPTNRTTISNATATFIEGEVRDFSVLYKYRIDPLTKSFVSQLSLTIVAQKSKDSGRRYIEEFVLNSTFDNSTLMRNWSDTPLTFIVRQPRFPHFQVKTDWQYWCPKSLTLVLCHIENGTSSCSSEAPYNLVSINLMLADTLFSGGNAPSHHFTDKVEECPLAYETKQDIGIACIVAFWSIVLAAVLWGVIKFLIKRSRKKRDD